MRSTYWILAALLVLLAAPIALRPKKAAIKADMTLVIITPHNEATRFEFERAFADFYLKNHGQRLRIDWRTVGGTSEIARFLASEYLAAFKNHWIKTLSQPWSQQVQANFDNPHANDPARAAFLASKVGCGIDLFFGGGSYDAMQQAAAGRLIDCQLSGLLPDVPQQLGGEPYWDNERRWFGTCLSAFGICYNPVALARLNVPAPARWSDLANPALRANVALADPTQSGAAAKAFEMLLQEQMLLAGDPAQGWENGLRLIRKLSANARYFTDSGTKVPLDVEAGDAAAGMCIDFYGRAQSERLHYITPKGGSSYGVDPIGLLRGAPHPELAKEFIRFVLSPQGQKLWFYKVGVPDGPQKYALRRLPILPELYGAEYRPYRSDPGLDPYVQAGRFVYHPEWTAPLFRTLGFLVRTMCIDSNQELQAAWRALIDAGFPPEATRLFEDVTNVNYDFAQTVIREKLRSADKLEQLRLARQLGDQFRAQYRLVEEKARAYR